MSEETLPLSEQNYGPGNVLRAKREEYEWSVEAVAEALHLSTHSVKAIEADRYDELPGATYVIGYWRSYARLLGIDIEETIEVNKRNLNIVTPEAAGLDINRGFGHKAKSRGKGWFLLLIVLAAFAYYAWQQQFFGLLDEFLSSEENTETTGSIQSGETPDAAQISPEKKFEQVLRPLKVEPAKPVELSAESVEPASDGADDSAETATDKKDSAQSGQSGLALQIMKVDKPAIEQVPEPGTQAGLILSQDAATSGAVSSETNASNNLLQAQTAPVEDVSTQAGSETSDVTTGQAATAQSASGMKTMTLTLSKDSWLDIRDKTRKRLLYKTEKAGQKIEVTGNPPFYIYIGTPDGVTIQYLGKEVPFETHKTGMFARFKLDDELLESM